MFMCAVYLSQVWIKFIIDGGKSIVINIWCLDDLSHLLSRTMLELISFAVSLAHGQIHFHKLSRLHCKWIYPFSVAINKGKFWNVSQLLIFLGEVV